MELELISTRMLSVNFSLTDLQQSGAADSSSDALVHTLRKYDALKEEFECYQKRYEDMIENHNATQEKLRIVQEENSRLKTQCHELTQERNAVIRERNALKQQVASVVRQWEGGAGGRHSADMKRLTDERNAAMAEYTLIMSERDTVHKEMEKLADDLQAALKRVAALEAALQAARDEQRATALQAESLRREIESALVDRDRAIKECTDLKTPQNAATLGKSRQDNSGYHHLGLASGVGADAFLNGQSNNPSLDNLKGLSVDGVDKERVDNLEQANQELERLRKQVDRLQGELNDALQEAEETARLFVFPRRAGASPCRLHSGADTQLATDTINTRIAWDTVTKLQMLCSTTDLTPTLIGIYDSLLAQGKSLHPESEPLQTAKDARNDPPVAEPTTMIKETKDNAKHGVETSTDVDVADAQHGTEKMTETTLKESLKKSGAAKLPVGINKSSLYSVRTKSEENGASDKSEVSSEPVLKNHFQRTFREIKETSAFGNLSPNVKRIISSASETTTVKFQKKNVGAVRSSTRYRSNIPLVGATSKISQSGVDILPSVEIYDQPCSMKSFVKSKTEDKESHFNLPIKPNFKLDEPQTYDVPTNNRPAIYDVPTKTAFESLSLPYIDQSIELSITSNDREFDIKLSSEDSPVKVENKTSPKGTPAKIPKIMNGGTNSLNRKDFKESPSKLSKIPPYPEAVGSTGDLKSSLPEKEVTRLNPAVEVTRPLSLSSIASSSSTSSSGVQNKGGVNSAYLASIESLDDHSDVDTSANGSNHFVNNAGNTSISEERRSMSPRQASEELPGLSQLERVCAEIVQTENVYVEDLRQVVEGYLHIWRQESTFSGDELAELFNNIEDIYSFNRSLCEELNSCQLDATCIARCFVNNTAGFAVYTSYCTGYPRTMERLAALASDNHSAREFRERQIALGHPLPLASYLLKPVQRILKYHLLLQNVVKQCASRETEYALLKMTGIAQHIDDMKRRHEHAVRVQEIQSLLYGWNGPDLTTYGELCAEGTFRVFGAKAMRHAFLFDKMLLVTKNREDGILAYKSHIMCNNMMLVESISGAPLSFHVIPWDAPRSQLTLQAHTHRHKREWTLLLKRVILENYNAVIPSHARQLVMELGQNKTDDDILAEKSHGLITQASMRKQLSAPEYLEKRKLERERRKISENGTRGRLKKTNRKYTVPNTTEANPCDCAQVSINKDTDYTCDSCYVDLCSDCETELNKDKGKDDKCACNNDQGDKCPECDRSLQYIDAGSTEQLERKTSECKCSDFQSSQESFSKEFLNTSSLTKTRGYHSSDNIVGYTDNSKSKEDLNETNNSLLNVRNIPKTCLKCAKIKENIPVTALGTTHNRKSRCNDNEKHKIDISRSKSKDDPQRSKLTKIGAWRRKSEPGLQQNPEIAFKKLQDSDSERNDLKGKEKIEFECRNCGSNKITRKVKINESAVLSDPEIDRKKGINNVKPNIEVKMYNSKHLPKKIYKLKKNRTKGLRLGSDTTAKFYADFSTDVSTENILHISESNDSLNAEKTKTNSQSSDLPDSISKDEDIDEETYKRLIEKTDSFKKNELEKVKYLNKQKVINEGSEAEEIDGEDSINDRIQERFEETEQPLEQIISQLLMQNQEFQKLLKKQQLRNSAQRRHQRLLKTHSNPEQVILSRGTNSLKLKAKYGRQISENLDTCKNEEMGQSRQTNEIDDASDEDHIYETLRVEHHAMDKVNSKDKTKQLITGIPRRLPSPPKLTKHSPDGNRTSVLESDYVYLSFDKLNTQNNDGVYDVPVKSPVKVNQGEADDYYVTMKNQAPPTIEESLYDSLVKVRRKKDVPSNLSGEYLPMSPEQQSPNTPEIWLSRQKEHFNVSRDRKSGSLPRSFQVVTSSPEENLSTFKCKPNSNSKTYLNREGKVLSIDRPFTIASDQSELSYDDVENYMAEGDVLKFNKTSKPTEADHLQNISQSTLELEEEIDRCYKTNFEDVSLDKNKNDNFITASQPNLNTSVTSSCEIIDIEHNEDKEKDSLTIHPEHKIYKPTTNMLSLKNVLSRFRNRTPNKHNEETEINANEESSPDSLKSDPKSPTSEKRSALNPRSYSKNLLQRFRSIIGDEHADDNQNRTETKPTKPVEDIQNNLTKSEIKVVITSTEASPTTSAIYSDPLSKSVYEKNTFTESQNEKNNLDTLSHSCDNIPHETENTRPSYDKSISLVSNMSSLSSIASQLKSNNSSAQTVNKLPIYMQGSKLLGARIAQSDYADPTTLTSEKSPIKNVNLLINKNSVRPDSLFSNSSFVTSSSEGAYQEQSKLNDKKKMMSVAKDLSFGSVQPHSDESYYEKTFEKIEQVTDEDVFRDSAVYSDQDENDENKTDNPVKPGKTVPRVETLKRNTSIKMHTVATSFHEKSSISSTTVTTNKFQGNNEQRSQTIQANKSKTAPPVPVKPKITNIPTATQNKSFIHKNTNLPKRHEEAASTESVYTRTIKRNSNIKPVARSESVNKANLNDKKNSQNKDETDNTLDKTTIQGNIQMKRLSFERASLDSATRKIKTNEKQATESSKMTTKSVLQRRLELEQMSRSTIAKNVKKPVQAARPKSITTKVATFERSISENGRGDSKIPSTSSERHIPSNRSSINENALEVDNDELKGSWVKQVVNKFQ